jgi:hypothetical protein
MRLSLMKAAHVALVSASSRKSGSPVFIDPRTLVRTWGTRPELLRAEEWFTRTPFQSCCGRKSGLPGHPFRVAAGGRVVYQDTGPGRQTAAPAPVPGRGGNDGYTSKAASLQLQSLPLHPRRMADSSRNDMLFSSGDSPNSYSAILSGDGVDRGNKENRSRSSPTLWFAANE